jgi:SPP1 family predicted phage head-tail adaptor
MSLDAGRLRDRITIQGQVNTQDENTGATVVSWSPIWTNLPASIEDLNQRELIAAQSQQSEVTSRIVLRYFPGVTAQHRIVDHEGKAWSIEGPPIRDKDTRQEYMTLSVKAGANDGR